MTLPDNQQYVKAIRMFKDEYFLDFINTEELDLSDPEDMDEMPGSYKVLAPIMEEVPKMLDTAGFEEGDQREHIRIR